MATPSTISVFIPETKRFKVVYCHYDGYLDGVGKTLLNHFNSFELANELVSLGHLSTVDSATNISEVCAYSRDRGESYNDNKPYEPDHFIYLKRVRQEYNYLFIGNSWYLIKSYNDETVIALSPD